MLEIVYIMAYHSHKRHLFVLLFFTYLFITCKNPEDKIASEKPLSITKEIAENLSRLPVKCLQKEYPNKLNQSLTDVTEIGPPAQLHPAFFGCYDWHSSVHGHWMLVKLLKQFPDLSRKDTILTLLTENLIAKNINAEIAYFKRKSEKSYERTYGWAWLLKLQQELDSWPIPEAKEIAQNLQPLTDLLVERYLEFLPRLNYPIRLKPDQKTIF